MPMESDMYTLVPRSLDPWSLLRRPVFLIKFQEVQPVVQQQSDFCRFAFSASGSS